MAYVFARAPRLILALALAITMTLLALSCSSDGEDGDSGDGGQNTYEVSMGDNLFDPKEFTVKAGQEVTFNLTNDGAAIHNMRVAGPDNQFSTDDDAVSDPLQMAGGETGTLVWTAPGEPGEIKVHCDFHPTDMTGTITVE